MDAQLSQNISFKTRTTAQISHEDFEKNLLYRVSVKVECSDLDSQIKKDTLAPDSVEEKPVKKEPVEEKPTEGKPAEEKPVEEKPAEEKPAEEKPVKNEPSCGCVCDSPETHPHDNGEKETDDNGEKETDDNGKKETDDNGKKETDDNGEAEIQKLINDLLLVQGEKSDDDSTEIMIKMFQGTLGMCLGAMLKKHRSNSSKKF